MTYTVYKNTDVDAPQLPDNLSILKACLVTGYGTGADEKQGAGWDLVYDEPTKKVFQPVDAKGENLMLRLDATNTNSQALSAWNSMTDIDNGDKAYDCGYLSKDAGEWILIATSSWCLLLQSHSSQSSVFSVFFHGNLGVLPDNDKRTVSINVQRGSSVISNNSYSIGSNSTLRKQSNNKAVKAYSAFDITSANTTTVGDLYWCDIAVSDEGGVIGVLPALKATPLNSNLQTWHQIEADVFALEVRHRFESKHMIMDFTNVS